MITILIHSPKERCDCLCQGERVAELILHHARANECRDVQQFKKEMAQLVEDALSSTLSLGKVANQMSPLSFLFFFWFVRVYV